MTNKIVVYLLAAFVLLLFAGGGVAWAHAELRTSSPAVGEVFRWSPPGEIRLSFTQEVDLSQSRVTVITRQFAPLPVGELAQDPSDLTTLHAHLPSLEDGTYTVNWESKSVDGHAMQGSYEFSVARRMPQTLAVGTPLLLLVGGLAVWQWRRRSPRRGGLK